MCSHSFSIKNPKTGKYELVPCGHCIECLTEMQAEWATRMYVEYKSQLSRPAVFITLTYNDENLPTEECNTSTGEVYRDASVVKRHIQDFMKKLRTRIERDKKKGIWKGWQGSIKYFITSEYGPVGGRPHYHGIIYGLSKNDGDLINEIWNKGFTYFGDVNEATCMYVGKYCSKPTEFQKNPDRKGYFDNERWMDENGIRRRPFRLMSLGLGSGYFKDRENLKWHFRDIFRNNYLRVNGKKKKLPRYFKTKIYTEENFKNYLERDKKKYNKYVKELNKIIKKDLKYGRDINTSNYSTVINRYHYYNKLTNIIENDSLSESNVRRDIEISEHKEYLLNEARRKWMQRAGRYHPQ